MPDIALVVMRFDVVPVLVAVLELPVAAFLQHFKHGVVNCIIIHKKSHTNKRAAKGDLIIN